MSHDCRIGSFLMLALTLLILMVRCPTQAQRSKRQRPTTPTTPPTSPPQFVDFRTDYKRQHIEDEINYSYHYYIDHAPTNVRLSHEEQRRGTVVSGHYGLLEPSGAVRSVRYEIDGAGGFRVAVQTRNAASRMLQRLQLPNHQQPDAPLQQAEPVAFIR